MLEGEKVLSELVEWRGIREGGIDIQTRHAKTGTDLKALGCYGFVAHVSL